MTDAPLALGVSGETFLPLIVVLGPTGAGKSELSLFLAHAFDAEIVNFDSVQVYRGLDIGSAKLPPSDRLGIPHHLLDVVEPSEEFTAGEYARRARAVLAEVSKRGKLPLLVGGTGFYLRALLDGLSPAPLKNQILRDRLVLRRPVVLHRLLRRIDPVSAARIHENDAPKLIRAIELSVETGRPASAVQAAPRRGLTHYRVLKLGLAPPREQLREYLNRRSALLFERGLLAETRALLDSGVPPSAKALQTIGYRQAVAYLRGELSLPEAVQECQARTRQYAKRQMTWLRAEQDLIWLIGFGWEGLIQAEALTRVRCFLERPSAVGEITR